MWPTLTDPLQTVAVVLAIAMALDALLKKPQKDAIRSAIARLQRAPIVPPKAIGFIDFVFGAKLFSFRSFLTSAVLSVFGAIVSVVIILLTTQDSSYILEEAARISSTYPIPTLLFLLIIIAFDVLSFFVTRGFVTLASQSASLGRGALLFVSDLLVSITICLLGLGLASTAMAITVPDDFWDVTKEYQIVTPPSAAIHAAMYSAGIQGTYYESSGLKLDPETPGTTRTTVETQGLLRAVADSHSAMPFSAQVDIMLGAKPEVVVASLNAFPRTYRASKWTCDGEEIDEGTRNTLVKTLYGDNPQPECPLPTFYWESNKTAIEDIEPDKVDDVFLGMTMLYLGKLQELVKSKFNNYIDVGVPEEWTPVVYNAAAWNRMAWFTSDNAVPKDRTLSYFYPELVWDEYYGKSVSTEPTSKLPSIAVPEEAPHLSDFEDETDRPVPAASTATEDTDEYSFDYYYNTYSIYEPAVAQGWSDPLYTEFIAWDGDGAAYKNHFLLPISPFLASALWMSLVFYLFTIAAFVVAILQGVLVAQAFLLRTMNWWKLPVTFVSFVFCIVFLGIAIALEFIPAAPSSSAQGIIPNS